MFMQVMSEILKCKSCKLFIAFNNVYCLDCFSEFIDFRPIIDEIKRCGWYEGCNNEGEEWSFDGVEVKRYCYEHAGEMGFCLWCGHFYGGVESFEFNNPGKICDNCRCWTCGNPTDMCECQDQEYGYEDWSDYP